MDWPAKRTWLFLYLCLHISFREALGVAANPKEANYDCIKNLRADIFSGYDKNARPVKTHNTTTIVYAMLNPTYFYIDEVKNMLTIHGWYELDWRDEHLQWTRGSYCNLTSVHVAIDELWVPDVTVHNNADLSDIDHFKSAGATVTPEGWVFWDPGTKFQTWCQIDLRQWPYDTQQCNISVGSWSNFGEDLDLKGWVRNGTVNMYYLNKYPSREWDVSSFEGYSMRWGDDTFFYPYVWYELKIMRRSESYSASVTVPALIIVLLNLATFWFHPTSPERLYVSLANAIIASLFLQYLGSLIPSNGSYAPLIVLFFRDSLVMIGISIAMTIVFRRLLSIQRTSPIPLPLFVTNLVDGWFGKILCLRGTEQAHSNNPESDGGLLDASSGLPKGSWDWLVLLFDRLAFILYLVVFAAFIMALL